MFPPKVNYSLFFNQCILCSRRASHPSGICSPCLTDLPWIEACCARCALPLSSSMATSSPGVCANCLQKPPSFDNVSALFRYEFPIAQLISRIKHNNQPQLIRHLSNLMSEHFDAPDGDTSLVPIPMHPSDLRKRGFNQAELLCRLLAKSFALPMQKQLLQKKRITPAQHSLDRAGRMSNMQDVFIPTAPIKGKLILVDDVMTTGATLEAASRVLKKAGAGQVNAWILARTE